MSTSQSPRGGRNNVLKDVHIPLPGACECVMLRGKWAFAGEITIQDPQMVPIWAELQLVEKQGEGNVPPATADTSETHVPATLFAGRQAPELP